MNRFLISIVAAALAVALLSAQDQAPGSSSSVGAGNNTSNATSSASMENLTGIWTTEDGAFYFSVRQVKNLVWWYSVRIHNESQNLTTTTARAGFDDDDDAEDAIDDLDDFRERFNSTYLSAMLNEHVFSGVVTKIPKRQAAGNDSAAVNSTAPYPVGMITGSWATIPITDLGARLLRDEDDEEWGVLALNILSDGSMQVIQQKYDNSFVMAKIVRHDAAASLEQQDGSLGPYSGGCICTREYRPVCGRTATGFQTFSNMCVMNCNHAVFAYRGACRGGSSAIPEDQEEPCICTLEYMPVCGKTPAGALQTFGNRCQLGCARASFEYQGECRSA